MGKADRVPPVDKPSPTYKEASFVELSAHDLRLLAEGLVLSGERYRKQIEGLSGWENPNRLDIREYLLEHTKTRLAEIDALLERMRTDGI